MHVSRSMSLPCLALLASGWAGALVVWGLWLLGGGGGARSALGSARVVGGVAAIAAGQFVFMVLVADRVFPGMGRRPAVWWTELASVVAVVLGLLWFATRFGSAWL